MPCCLALHRCCRFCYRHLEERLTTMAATTVALHVHCTTFQKVFVYFYLRLYSFSMIRPLAPQNSRFRLVFRHPLSILSPPFLHRSFLCVHSHLCNVPIYYFIQHIHSFVLETPFFNHFLHSLSFSLVYISTSVFHDLWFVGGGKKMTKNPALFKSAHFLLGTIFYTYSISIWFSCLQATTEMKTF